jgi:ferric-dicitrate binding protein FerR (iron transport regulator)
VSTAPERRSRFVRWLRVGLRVTAVAVVVLLLPAACAVMTLQSDYAARDGELQEMPLEGPATVIAGFEGSWFVG